MKTTFELAQEIFHHQYILVNSDTVSYRLSLHTEIGAVHSYKENYSILYLYDFFKQFRNKDSFELNLVGSLRLK